MLTCFKKNTFDCIISNGFIGCFAQGLVLNNDDLRTDLNWLNQQGVINISTSTWPLSGDEIQRALSQAKVTHPAQQKLLIQYLMH